MKQLAAILALALAGLVPRAAFAQTTPAAHAAPPAAEALALQGDIDRYAAEAEASDCNLACRALDSMRRAAERICEIQPGDPCARAGDTVRRTATRVHAACPECASARDVPAPTGGTAAAPPMAPPAPLAATPGGETQAVHKGGGCAGCATSGQEDGSPFLVLLAASAAWAARRRRARG